MMINGAAHGPMRQTTTCQVHMRSFTDGDEIWIEPWRARAFSVVKDLIVDRSSFDRIVQAGGFISAPTGSAQDANAIPIPKQAADDAMDAAACIGCGACVAACPNSSASLFTAAKISHLGLLPQGQPERYRRALHMVAQMDIESFGGCSLFGECQEACPKGISIDFISRMNRDFLVAAITDRGEGAVAASG
jgi:succinate dehydrogenase / fumarate reductase, iron-sulfur subunit